MRRQRLDEEHENHERWVISYADFITLLFAFFVVMYSISSVNEGKYKVLSNSLMSVFNSNASLNKPLIDNIGFLNQNMQDNPVDFPVKGNQPVDDNYKYSIEGINETEKSALGTQSNQGDINHLTKLSEDIALSIDEYMHSGAVDMTLYQDRIEINIKAEVLFASGKSNLLPKAKQLIQNITSDIEFEHLTRISVAGHTDNQPINDLWFPSNWELSSQRSGSVVRLMESTGVDPLMLEVVGYGQHKPIADNSTQDGRAQNRRISIVLHNRQNKAVDQGVKVLPPEPVLPTEEVMTTVEDKPLKAIQRDDGSIIFTTDEL